MRHLWHWINISKATSNGYIPLTLHIGQISSEGCEAGGSSSSRDCGDAGWESGQFVIGEQEDCVGEAGLDWGCEGGWEGGLTLRLNMGGDPAPEVSQALLLRRCGVAK